MIMTLPTDSSPMEIIRKLQDLDLIDQNLETQILQVLVLIIIRLI